MIEITTLTFPKTDGNKLDATPVNELDNIYTAFDILRIAVTDSDANDDYASGHQSHLIFNFGTTDCYINFEAAATTSTLILEAKTMLAVDGVFTSLHAITAAGTTSVACLGLK